MLTHIITALCEGEYRQQPFYLESMRGIIQHIYTTLYTICCGVMTSNNTHFFFQYITRLGKLSKRENKNGIFLKYSSIFIMIFFCLIFNGNAGDC